MNYRRLDNDAANENTPSPSVWSIISRAIGAEVLSDICGDARLVYLSKMSRMFFFGFLAVVLVEYLLLLGFSNKNIGSLFTLTLLGDVALSLILTSHADRWGRRICLLIGSILSTITALIFSTQSSYWLLLLTAIFGVISPSGNEVGPFMAIELSALSQVTPQQDRTRLMAWFNLASCFASASGALFCGIFLSVAQSSPFNSTRLSSCRHVMLLYSIGQLVPLALFYHLSPAIEVPDQVISAHSKAHTSSLSYGTATGTVTATASATDNHKTTPSGSTPFLGLHKSKMIVFKLSLLFILDSFAGGFILTSLISAWFQLKFDTSPVSLGTMIFVCNLVAGISALFAATLADKIGLIWTMAVTHLPSNFLCMLVPLMPTESAAIFILCLRFSISQMDVPTRNAYVQGVVDEDERSAANGITNLVRSFGVSTAPFVSEILMSSPHTMNYPFYIAGGLKVVYDLLLLWSFHALPTQQEKEEEDQKKKNKEVEEEELLRNGTTITTTDVSEQQRQVRENI